MKNKINILSVFSEVDPFSKAGGLGDVGRSLPKALSRLGHNVIVVTPLYGCIDRKKYKLELVVEKHKMRIDESTTIFVNYYKSSLRKNLPIYFVDIYDFFRKYKKIYGVGKDNNRFWAFDLATLHLIKILELKIDIIHCNDWQAGLIPYLISYKFKKNPFLKDIVSLFTIHNLVFQFGKNWWEVKNGDRDDGRSKLPLFKDFKKVENINFAKRGIMHSCLINAVSETYAEEILTKNFGEDLHRILRNRQDRLFGIINGIDYNQFNPKTDQGIVTQYDSNSLNKKIDNKIYLQKKFSLKQDPNIPLIGMASRITEQKGFDLFFEIIDNLMRRDVQVVVLGGGEKKYEKKLSKMMKKYPKKFAANLEFDSKNVTQLYAGSDMFLMPSRFEPCGLGQLISLRYGSIPVTRATGGLVDTVSNYKFGSNEGNGFVFKNYNSSDLLFAIARALTVFENKKEWIKLVHQGMKQSYSWEIPAKKYISLFRKGIRLCKGNK